MPPSEEKLRQYNILLQNLQAIGKSQSFYVNSLFTFLFFVWAVEILHQSGGVTISALGVSVQLGGLWQIVPLVTALLTLGLAGSINIIHHAWRRLNLCLMEICEEDDFFFAELDSNKNILDYLGFLTWHLKKPILPDTIGGAAKHRTSWRISSLLYPSLILLSIETTYASLTNLPWGWRTFAYVFGSVALQTFATLPFLWRKLCLFFGVHKNEEDGVDWGTDAYYNMPFRALERVMNKNQTSRDKRQD